MLRDEALREQTDIAFPATSEALFYPTSEAFADFPLADSPAVFQTPADLKRVRYNSKRLIKSFRNEFERLGADRHIIVERAIPDKKVLISDERPSITLNLMRKVNNGIFATEAVLIMFPQLGEHNGHRHVYAIKGVSIHRPGYPGKRMIGDFYMSPCETLPQMGRRLFKMAKQSGYIENHDYPFVPLDSRADTEEAPDNPLLNNFSDFDFSDESTLKPKKREKRRRMWSQREKYIRNTAARLQTEFRRQAGYKFKTIDIAINPQTETFRLTFHAKKAFQGRYAVLEGNFGIEWDPKGHEAADFTLNIERTNMNHDFQTAAADSIDVTDQKAAVSHLLSLLHDAQQLVYDERAERMARMESDARPRGQHRRQLNRSDRRNDRRALRHMRGMHVV